MSKVKLSITLAPAVAEKLPKVNKSMFIEERLKEHFQSEGVQRLYAKMKEQLLQDYEFESYIAGKFSEFWSAERDNTR